MIKNLKLLFLGFSITVSTLLSALENPLRPMLEVLKASGIAQEKLKYANDISFLINNGNSWAFVAALTLKYGYNPFGDKPFIKLSDVGTIKAFKDFDVYSKIAQNTYQSLVLEKSQAESSHSQKRFEMGLNGVVQTGGSAVACKILGLLGSVKYIAWAYLAFGIKKMYDATYYQQYLTNRLESNGYIENVLERANRQLNKNAAQRVQDVIQQSQDLPQKIQGAAQKLKQNAQVKN